MPLFLVIPHSHVIPRYDAVLHVILRYDAVLYVIPRYDAVSRNTGKGNTYKRPLSGPRPLGHSALDAESRNTRAGNIGKGTCPLRPLSGPRIVVRGDPV